LILSLIAATVLLAAVALNSAVLKMRRHEEAFSIVGGAVGIPEDHVNTLAGIEIAGAVGILMGLLIPPLGILAAAGLAAYFGAAIIAHLRVGDLSATAVPLVPLFLSLAVLGLRVMTA